MWNLLRRLPTLAAIGLCLIAAPLRAQVPPPVPALPDTERRTQYSISGSTCSCSVGFALFGDGVDFGNWIEVWVNGVLQSSSTYTITSPTGPLATIPRPITNAVLTFNAATTGTVQIVGARRPRRTTQFRENQGVAARDLNQAISDLVAVERELWDKTNDVTGRSPLVPPGETIGTLPPLASRKGFGACFDSTTGNIVACASVPATTFAAGTGVTFTGSSPTTISATTFAAGSGIALSGGGPTTIATTYTAPGTGAVVQTIASSLSNQLWAKDFGAVCNGLANDQAAFQNMLNAAGSLFLEAKFTGQCKINSALSITASLGFRGSSPNTAVLIPGSYAIDAIDISSANYVNVRDLSIQYAQGAGCSPTGNSAGIRLTGFSAIVTFDNLVIICAENGMIIDGTGANIRAVTINNINIAGSPTSASMIGILMQGVFGDGSISGSEIDGGGGAVAIKCVVCSGLRVTNNKINGSWTNGVVLGLVGVRDGDFILSNNSIEGISAGGAGLSIARGDTTSLFGTISVTGGELSGGYCVRVPTDATGRWLWGLNISGVVCVPSIAGFAVDSVVGVSIVGNTVSGGAAVVPTAIGSAVQYGVAGPNICAGATSGANVYTSAACAASTNAGASVTTFAPY